MGHHGSVRKAPSPFARLVPKTLAIAALALVGALAGCGSGGSSGTTTEPTVPELPKLTLTSSAFADRGAIPADYACEADGGQGLSPPLAWGDLPEGTAELVLVVHDPDAPVDGGFTHLVTRLDPTAGSVPAGANRDGGPMADWVPLCPPDGEHTYTFTLYAFPRLNQLPAELDRDAVLAHQDEALDAVRISGTFAAP